MGHPGAPRGFVICLSDKILYSHEKELKHLEHLENPCQSSIQTQINQFSDTHHPDARKFRHLVGHKMGHPGGTQGAHENI